MRLAEGLAGGPRSLTRDPRGLAGDSRSLGGAHRSLAGTLRGRMCGRTDFLHYIGLLSPSIPFKAAARGVEKVEGRTGGNGERREV